MDDVKDKFFEIVERVNKFLAEAGRGKIKIEHAGMIREDKWSHKYILVLAKDVRFDNQNEFLDFRRALREGIEADHEGYSPAVRRRYGRGYLYQGERIFTMNKPERYYEGRSIGYMLSFRGNAGGFSPAEKRAKGYNSKTMFDLSKPITFEIMMKNVVDTACGYVYEDVIFEKAFLFGMDYTINKTVAIAKYFDWVAERKIGKVRWEDIGGMKSAKDSVEKMTIICDEHPEVFADEERDHILLVGPPGVGKTLIVKGILWRLHGKANILPYSEVAKSLGVFGEDVPTDVTTYILNFINTLHKHTGRWTYLFIDEIDSIGQENTQAKALLREMDNVGARHFSIIATTNRPDVMDFALFRPGRFYPIVFIDMPKLVDREAIWKVANEKYGLGLENTKEYAKRTDNFSGADIMHLAKMGWRESKIQSLDDSKLDMNAYLSEMIVKVKKETTSKNKFWCDRVKGFVSQSEATVMYV